MSENETVAFEGIYSNDFTYLKRPLVRNFEDSNADVIVTGVPYDMATAGRPGTRYGPKGVRSASTNIEWEECRWPWDFEVFSELDVVDYGDLVFMYGDSQSLVDELQAHTARVLNSGKKLLTFGGDHFIALPLMREHAKYHGKLSVIHFDAHTDTSDYDNPFDHGTVFHCAKTENLVDPARSVQVGIRTDYVRDGHEYTVIDAATVNDQSPKETIRQIREIVGDNKIYISFDIDCLDPAYAPGTGTPVCGGLTTDTALKLLRGLEGLDIVGMDIVEVSPPFDHAEVTSLAAATIGLEYLYLLAAYKRR